MPEGQFSGSKGKYVYTSDAGKALILTLDDTLVITNSGLTPFDPATPPADSCPAPKRFKPRGVYWQATAAGFVGKRKFLICGTNDAALYATDTPQEFTVDGVAGSTTGRRGEQQSY